MHTYRQITKAGPEAIQDTFLIYCHVSGAEDASHGTKPLETVADSLQIFLLQNQGFRKSEARYGHQA